MHDKKQNEIKIVTKLYKRDRFVGHDDDNECPDFVLFDNQYKVKFGVEIRELYKNSASARYKNIPTYFNEIMEGKYRSKADAKTLVKDNYILDDPKEGISIPLAGVMIKKPSIEEYSKILSLAVKEKNSKYLKYEKLPYINLIIFDKENSFGSYTNSDIQNVIVKEELKNVFLFHLLMKYLYCLKKIIKVLFIL